MRYQNERSIQMDKGSISKRMSRALDKAPHINSGLGGARDVVTTKVDNSGDRQGPLGQGKVDEKGVGLLRAVQGKTSSLLKVIQCKRLGLYTGKV